MAETTKFFCHRENSSSPEELESHQNIKETLNIQANEVATTL